MLRFVRIHGRVVPLKSAGGPSRPTGDKVKAAVGLGVGVYGSGHAIKNMVAGHRATKEAAKYTARSQYYMGRAVADGAKFGKGTWRHAVGMGSALNTKKMALLYKGLAKSHMKGAAIAGIAGATGFAYAARALRGKHEDK